MAMSINLICSDSRGHTFGVQAGCLPDECPLCHYAIAPRGFETNGYVYYPDPEQPDAIMEVLVQCPRLACDRLFLAKYEADAFRAGAFFQWVGCYPQSFKGESFAAELERLSTDFVAIYNEAAKAEADGLLQVAGPGYRKALEFLVKDYLCHKTPADTDTIKATALGRCIADLDDKKLKTCAERAVWIGNDETHYIKKITNADMNDLKTLIKLAVNRIDSDLLTEEYEKKIKKPS